MSGFFARKEQSFEELVYRGVESDELDYKARMSWRTMSRSAKGKLLRHMIAFANTRGGYLVIGVGEDQFGNPNVYTGVSPAEAGSFDPSAVGNFISSHVEPPIDFTIERPVIRGKKYVIFVIHPFKTMPHVCTNSIEGEVQSGVFYIRTVEASSRPARRAMEMQELIHRALRNEREALGNVLRSILQESGLSAQSANRLSCSDTIEESEHYFHRRTASFKLPQLKLIAEPTRFEAGSFTPDQLRKAFFKALRPDIRFLHKNEAEALPTPGSLRYISLKSRRMWQFFDSGLFCFFAVLSEPQLKYSDIIQLAAVAVDFFSRLCTALNRQNEPLALTLEIANPESVQLIDHEHKFKIEPAVPCRAVLEVNASDLEHDKIDCAAKLAGDIGKLFNVDETILKKLSGRVRKYLEIK